MFGVSGQHLLMFIGLLLIVFVFFGAQKLPEFGAGVGKAIREFKKASTEVRDGIVNSASDDHARREPGPVSAPGPQSASNGAARTDVDRRETTPVTSSNADRGA